MPTRSRTTRSTTRTTACCGSSARLLNPLLKLFFNPNPIAAALNAQVKVNREAARREAGARADAGRVERAALHPAAAARHRGLARQPRDAEPRAARRVVVDARRFHRAPHPRARSGPGAAPGAVAYLRRARAAARGRVQSVATAAGGEAGSGDAPKAAGARRRRRRGRRGPGRRRAAGRGRATRRRRPTRPKATTTGSTTGPRAIRAKVRSRRCGAPPDVAASAPRCRSAAVEPAASVTDPRLAAEPIRRPSPRPAHAAAAAPANAGTGHADVTPALGPDSSGSREARPRRAALRRGHRRRLGAARAVHRRAPRGARRRAGAHHLRPRLRVVEERVPGRRHARQRHRRRAVHRGA